MLLHSLGYIGIGTRKLSDWSGFATSLVGMQVLEKSRGGLALRMDDRSQRLFVEEGATEGCRVFGWEVADGAALDLLAKRLEAGGVEVVAGSPALADQRMVRALISFKDPLGNQLEAFHGPMLADGPVDYGRAISGFRTGALGLGHIALMVSSLERVLPFYRDLLGFQVSDYVVQPFRGFFLHINGRHHSLALLETGRNDVHHLMVELFSLDDVGQGYDLAQVQERKIGVTLGRHTNDLMTSFYVHTPSQFLLEYGWGGREIDPATWEVQELTHGPSLWGHERAWLPPEQRALAREMRLKAAADGVREPVQVTEGYYRAMGGAASDH